MEADREGGGSMGRIIDGLQTMHQYVQKMVSLKKNIELNKVSEYLQAKIEKKL